MRFYECDRHAAKNLVLKHLHGGKVRKWLTDFNISKDVCAKVAKAGHHRIVTSLEKECEEITKFFMDTFPTAGTRYCASHRSLAPSEC